ncbi:HEAT repeat domain-containing protein [Funiculus sociatus]|uniref:HEAT repeat domain-containing protein n=1 Tax=Funiculus sociatus TaxID=450527 RepID=UPI0032986571
MIDWKPYLEALCNQYAQWWKVYTLTDVVGRQRVEAESPPLLEFVVEMVQPAKGEPGEAQQKTERLGVLEGLRKYAADHVLLVGRPGSGKSTALARLLLEEAQASREINFPADSESRLKTTQSAASSPFQGTSAMSQGIDSLADSGIPVLVELRYYQTSVLDLIRDFLKQHGLFLNTSEIERLLFENQFLLLVDGINELPSQEARRDLHKFRQDYQRTTPMIFTTRDLGLGGDLDITKKLEMQPLSEAQMQQFVRAYLPQQEEQMLRQLGSRLREFGQTPLLLWMLCSVFADNRNKIPSSLGSVFRRFTQIYTKKLKQDIPISGESRRWLPRLLEQLAWVMTSGKAKTELQVAIPRQEAEAVLTEFLAGKVAHPEDCVLCWLEDLLNHHLIQLGASDQIEFRHQLIQEYYTAESLLKLLPSLDDEELKREYLNYLKWTEPLVLMLVLVEDEAQAVRVVKLALEVDLGLGARLAGAVKPEWRGRTTGLVAELEVTQEIKDRLLIRTRSDSAEIPDLMFDLGNKISDSTLLEDGSETALLRTLKNEDSRVRSRAAKALGQIGTEAAITALLQALNDEDSRVRSNAAKALGQIGSDAALPGLLQTFHAQDYEVRESATYALGELRSEAVIPTMLQALRHKGDEVRESAVYVLEQLGSKSAIPGLLRVMQDADSDVRWRAACVLGKLGNEAAIPVLLEVLNDEDYKYSVVPWRAACALVQLGYEAAIPVVLKALHDADYEDYEMYWFYEEAAKALGQLDAKMAIPALHQALHDTNPKARETAIKVLGKLDTEAAIPYLRQALNDEDSHVRISASEALGKISDEAAVPALLQALNDEDSHVYWIAANALGKIASPALIPDFSLRLKTDKETYLLNTISAIQERCKFYNHTLTQPILTPEPQLNIPPIQRFSIPLMHILHLSDLHFSTPDQANLWSTQLRTDLRRELSIPHLDALILSGDIANYSTEEEYKAAEEFLNTLCRNFTLKPEQIILVPGNHDLNWKLAKKAYKLTDRDGYDGELKDGHYIEESASVIRVRDDGDYKQRFAHFSSFYETIKQKPYPLDYDQQYTLDHLKEQNLLILGLNSAWQLDHHYKTRASINMGALSNALTQIDDNPDYDNCLKIAVWHHPLDSAYSDRITDQGFLEQLAVNGFRFFLHGHIHKAETSLFRYDMSTNGRKLDRICAGTFGAPVREWVPGYPLQYNLLKIEDNQLSVYTRRREEVNGAWKPDARWLQGAGKTPLDYYAIAL